MYNKYIFINNNRKKKQKELEEKKKLEDSQISFDMLIQTEKNENNNIKEINKKVEQNTLSLENNKLIPQKSNIKKIIVIRLQKKEEIYTNLLMIMF